jgi:hypothetical protein
MTIWANNRLTLERWGTGEWKIGFGWWDGAFELYLVSLILRFQGTPGDYR